MPGRARTILSISPNSSASVGLGMYLPEVAPILSTRSLPLNRRNNKIYDAMALRSNKQMLIGATIGQLGATATNTRNDCRGRRPGHVGHPDGDCLGRV
jgi:hypothetical protein